MRDLKSSRTMWLKAYLFLVLVLLSVACLLIQTPRASTLVLAILLAWATARLYYFVFYVLHAYIDPTLKYSGLVAMFRELARRR